MEKLESKNPRQSAVEARYLLMPGHANPYGTAFGGTIMAWIDMVGSMAAQRHCCKEVVTAGIDSLSFKHPIYIGDHVLLKACVNYAGSTSMEVGVQVSREDPFSNEQTITTTAYLTFVALDENKKPVAVPAIVPVDEEAKRRCENAKLRVQARKELRQKTK